MENNQLGFRPTDIEKITYLVRKASGESPSEDFFVDIPTIDVYGNREPWELFSQEILNEEKVHFFSNLKKGKKTDDRSVGAGAWKIRPDKTEDILDLKSEKVGLMKSYEYTNPSEPQHDRKWILDEYTLAGRIKGCVKSQYKGLSFCTLTRKLTDPATDSACMWLYKMCYNSQIKSSRMRKQIICPDDVC